MTRLADLLRQGAVLKKAIQPYESHMQYVPQWMCDYNLYGCAYIDSSKTRFRSPIPDHLDVNSASHQWHDQTIPPNLVSHEEILPRQSHCSLEVDICAEDILNRSEIKPRALHHDFIERTHPLSSDDKLVHSMAGLWSDETRRRKARIGGTNAGNSPYAPEVLVSISADPRNVQPGGWIHEEEYMEKVLQIVREERAKSDAGDITFDNFVKKVPSEGQVKTTLESVEDLYPRNLLGVFGPASISSGDDAGAGDFEIEDIEVDESRILNYEGEDVSYGSDDEIDMPQPNQGDHIEEQQDGDEITETIYDNEIRPDGNIYGKRFKDTLDPVTSGEATGPTSSEELEALGIQNFGNYNNIGEDTFDIPQDCASDIREAIARNERAKALGYKTEHVQKRRKVIHDGSLNTPKPLSDKFLGHESHGLDAEAANHVKLDQYSREVNYTTDQVEQITDGETRQRLRGDLNYQSQLFQERLDTTGSFLNSKLSFPVVKDPQDPSTMQRLSQKIRSPTKAYQKSIEKHVLFDTSIEQKSISFDNSKNSSMNGVEGTTITSLQVLEVSSRVHTAFVLPDQKRILCISDRPPTALDLNGKLLNTIIPAVIYQDAYYSDEWDVPERPREYAGKEFKLESRTVPYLPNFDSTGASLASLGKKPGIVVDHLTDDKLYQKQRRACHIRVWEIGSPPPARSEVQMWLDGDGVSNGTTGKSIPSSPKNGFSQIDGPTQKRKHGFGYSQKQQSTSVQHETQYMSIMSLEIHVNTRGNLVPNPEQDEIACLFWCLQSGGEDLEVDGTNEGTHIGIAVLSETEGLTRRISKQTAVEVEEESTELDLINRIVDIVRKYDPDILTGYEVHGGSWGYIIERARFGYDYNLCDEFSRMKSQSHGRFGKDNDRWGFNHTSTIRVTGRHMINIWRAMRGELNLLQYTMENVVFHILHRRIPHFSFHSLTKWYTSSKSRDLAKVIDYYISRVQLDLEILEQNELVPRTSEQARLLGVDFFSVFSRGSQFKVESLMFRIAKPENFLLVSPSRKQVGQQNALECLPLVMEPQSAFYTSPLLVLDFQSLYPSVMIAYNYCYSTFLGRVVSWRGQNKMGFTDFKREQRLLELFRDQINIAPNGMMYVRPEIRKSLLAKMLGEILETRVMVKSGMKIDKDDKTLQRLLNNRQLALKLIANVTYGYTSASFSGRMPCSEIADSIVQTGRETLEKAIALIHSVKRWSAEVVYGDTDSLFVYLKGRTKDDAFDIGTEIANTITDMNPRPVKLKFEKVYFPCVLLAKKRYVGFKYESKSQKEPDFDAKGIETVRRDGTPAEQKIEEKALKILFHTADLSQVKSYFQKQCMKIMKGKVSIQDFCFAKEVKLGTYSEKGPPPPGALISTRRMLEDPRAEPQYGERVPYVVITGAPGARLIDRCVAPDVLLQNDHHELDSEYYISKNLIPPLERIFNLVGANVRQWYDEMPKFQHIRRIENSSTLRSKDLNITKKTLESYMKSSSCLVCRNKLEAELPICSNCMQYPNTSLLTLRSRLNRVVKKATNLEKVCRSCAGLTWGEEVACDSKDCPVLYTRTRHMTGLGSAQKLMSPVVHVLEEIGDAALEW